MIAFVSHFAVDSPAQYCGVCLPASLPEGSASCSLASMICLQCQRSMPQHRRAELTSIPGLYTVRKNSRSPEAAPVQCYFVLAPNQLEKR
jgi:hypothetical protein